MANYCITSQHTHTAVQCNYTYQVAQRAPVTKGGGGVMHAQPMQPACCLHPLQQQVGALVLWAQAHRVRHGPPAAALLQPQQPPHLNGQIRAAQQAGHLRVDTGGEGRVRCCSNRPACTATAAAATAPPLQELCCSAGAAH
eukprot:1141334-Pelagomonas_calceolata.AAC.5